MRSDALHFNCGAHFQRSIIVFGAVVAAMAGAVLRLNAGAPVPGVMVVDIIPEVLSGETNTNSEPSLGVNPRDPSQIAAWAFIPEPMGGKATPIFISTDGGQTWSCRSTLPVLQKNSCDITMRFGGLLNMLYVAGLHDPKYIGPQDQYKPELVICANDRLAKNPMQPVGGRGGEGVDQPHVAAATINKHDRVFIGDNDWNGPSGRTATIDRSLDGAGSSPAFTPIPIEFRNDAKDSSEVRPAISADGTKVYAAYNRVSAYNDDSRVGDVILVRDDDGGNSAAPFTALRGENGVPGLPVVKARTFAWDTLLGRDRNGGDLAIAVDPRNANTVYLVWGELVQGQPTLHIIRSDDAGVKWSINLRTVTKAKNPGLAITANGTLGFLYQQVISPENGQETWVTKLERTKNSFGDTDTLTLATFPVAEVPTGNQPKLGDYLQLMAVGNDFYGIFSASNVPDLTRFPCGVTFQRHVDLKAKTLLGLDGNKVAPSIDPFFVRVRGE
jgi:hypothetical protein